MKVVISNAHYIEVDHFVQSLREMGDPVEVETPSPAEAHFAGGYEGVVQISIDPETVKQIFEYTALLLGAYKATDYVGEFFRAIIKKMGEITGAKIVKELALLWKKLNHRVMDDNAKGGHTRIYLGFDIPIGEDRLSVDNSIFASTIQGLSDEDHEQSFYLVFLKLLPLIKEFVLQCRLNCVKLDKIAARFDPDEPWSWWIDIQPIGSFVLTKDGRFLSKYPIEFLRWRYFLKRRCMQNGIKGNDIAVIIRAYARSR